MSSYDEMLAALGEKLADLIDQRALKMADTAISKELEKERKFVISYVLGKLELQRGENRDALTTALQTLRAEAQHPTKEEKFKLTKECPPLINTVVHSVQCPNPACHRMIRIKCEDGYVID